MTALDTIGPTMMPSPAQIPALAAFVANAVPATRSEMDALQVVKNDVMKQVQKHCSRTYAEEHMHANVKMVAHGGWGVQRRA